MLWSSKGWLVCSRRLEARLRIALFSAARIIRWSSTCFRRHLPPFTRLLSQPDVVADSLEDYLQRHTHFSRRTEQRAPPVLLTSGDPAKVSRTARIFWPDAPAFTHLNH
jgi:hypothetical protein